MMSEACWEPLEATPQAFNTLANALGVPWWKFVDVVDWDSVPSDAVAWILMYPTTVPEIESHLHRTAASSACGCDSSNVFFVRQLIGGSCGTIAALHAMINGITEKEIPATSPLHEIIESLDKHLRDDFDNTVLHRSRGVVENVVLQRAHEIASGTTGAQVVRCAGQRQGRHFLTFFKSPEGILWELDGRRKFPVCRGSHKDVMVEVQGILQKAPDIHFGFALLALVPGK